MPTRMSRERRENRAKTIAQLRGQMLVAPSAQFTPSGAWWLGLLMFGLFCVRETTIGTLDKHANVERRIDDAEAGKVAVCQADGLPDSETGRGDGSRKCRRRQRQSLWITLALRK